MLDNFLANSQQEGQTLDEILSGNSGEQETETPADSPAEDNQTEQSPSSRGEEESEGTSKEKPKDSTNTENANNLPFNKDPRFKEILEERNKYREELAKMRAEMDERFAKIAPPTQQEKKEIPEPFVKLFGENEEVWNQWKALSEIQREQIKQEVIAEQERAVREKQEEQQRWDKWRDESIAKIEEKFGVSLPDGSSDRNELLSIATKFLPTDEDGNISFEKSYELMQALRKDASEQKAKARKSIAAATAPEAKAEPEPNDFFTPKDFKRIWRR